MTDNKPKASVGNHVYDSRRIRATVYFEPELKDWLKIHASKDGRSLSSMVDVICTTYAKEHGYEEKVEAALQVELTPQTELTPQIAVLTPEVNPQNPTLTHLLSALSIYLEGATKCLAF